MNALRILSAVATLALAAISAAPDGHAQRPNPEPQQLKPWRNLGVTSRPIQSTPVTISRPEEIIAPQSVINLEAGKGSLLRLKGAAASVFVANPEIADVQVRSPSLIYVLGKGPGETAIFAVDDQDRVILNSTLIVNHNLTRLRQHLHAVMPDEGIQIASVENSIILAGAVTSATQAEEARRIAERYAPPPAGRIINQLKVAAPNQINLRVKIAEVSRDDLKAFGFNWDAAMLQGNFLFGLASGLPVTAGTGFITRNAVDGIASTSFLTSFRDGKRDINSLVDALSRENLITVLAEPNLTAMSGETASFLAGGEFPVPVPQSSNTGTSGITIEFKKFGVSLAFTPTILDGERINLKVRPEVSQLTQAGSVSISGFVIPALTTRRAETTVELGSGQSFAIAGLLQNNTNQDMQRTPFLADVPIIGPLFRSDRFKRNETELVIIVTPYVVKPVSAKLSAPTDGYVAPSDSERALSGKGYREQAAPRPPGPRGRNGQGLIGPSGFVLD